MTTSVEEVISNYKKNCDSTIQAFKKELGKIRTGRASSGLLEGIMVDYYGTKTALSHLGQISTPEARLIVIQVYDVGAVQSVEKAIQSADLGLNPSREGNTIRISTPQLTEERRKDIIKLLHKMTEDIRVSIRNHRRDANEQLKKLEKQISLTQDDLKRHLENIQKMTNSFIEQVDKLLVAKEAECMEV